MYYHTTANTDNLLVFENEEGRFGLYTFIRYNSFIYLYTNINNNITPTEKTKHTPNKPYVIIWSNTISSSWYS